MPTTNKSRALDLLADALFTNIDDEVKHLVEEELVDEDLMDYLRAASVTVQARIA